MTATPADAPEPKAAELSIEELARLHGVKPIQSLSELAHPDLFADDEIEDFLADLYASRRSDVGRASSSLTLTSPPRSSRARSPRSSPRN